jgi:hypothetical protein
MVQETIWRYEANRRGKAAAAENKIGPYTVLEEQLTRIRLLRIFACNDYDACLTYAARKNWDSFTCRGCKKAEVLRGIS